MEGLQFIDAAPPVVSDRARADIACFVGFIGRRPVPPRESGETESDYLARVLPAWLRGWLAQQDWNPGWHGRTVDDLVALRNVPVLIDAWDAFESLFAWDERPLDTTGRICDTVVGVAVRSFFSQGGRRCYVVRVDDPWPYCMPSTFDSTALLLRRSAREALRPTMPAPVAADRSSWRGIGHLFGLPDVSLLCLPDVPEVFALESWPRGFQSESAVEERFVEMGALMESTDKRALRHFGPPRCDEHGFSEWAAFVRRVGEFLKQSAREVQFLAAVPLPADELSLAGSPDAPVGSPDAQRRQAALKIRAARDAQWRAVAEIRTAFVQLVYPWIRNRDSGRLPGDLAAPDSMLSGLLAANALMRGTWNSMVRQSLPGVDAVEPVEGAPAPRLRDRVTVFGPTAGGMRILSDVTTDDDVSYRPANLSRLISALARAARVLGEQSVFENNGETLWNRLRDRFVNLMTGLWAQGALTGSAAAEAFEVRCDRGTMTQADLDAGRAIVRVSFTAAMPVTRIVVAFAFSDAGGGQVSLLGSKVEALS
jgi:hypothetical protein